MDWPSLINESNTRWERGESIGIPTRIEFISISPGSTPVSDRIGSRYESCTRECQAKRGSYRSYGHYDFIWIRGLEYPGIHISYVYKWLIDRPFDRINIEFSSYRGGIWLDITHREGIAILSIWNSLKSPWSSRARNARISYAVGSEDIRRPSTTAPCLEGESYIFSIDSCACIWVYSCKGEIPNRKKSTWSKRDAFYSGVCCIEYKDSNPWKISNSSSSECCKGPSCQEIVVIILNERINSIIGIWI